VSNIAFINTGKYSSSRGLTSFSDPVHLVAMSHLCKEAGHQSGVFQLGVPSVRESILNVYNFNPDVLGLSFLAPFKNELQQIDQLLRPFRHKGIHLLLGGPDIQFDPAFYIERYGGERAQEWASCILVDGPGETLIKALAACNFDFSHPEVQSSILSLGAKVEQVSGLWKVSGLREMSLDEQGYEREYDLAPFDDKAGVKWATGCWAACSFCPNIPGKSAYKSPERAVEEALYLQRHGALKLDVASPQFTAHPGHASKLVGALPPETPPVFFSSRIDSLYHAITRFPEEWKRFANQNTHGIGLGVDSFLPDKLMRLRKYHAIAQAHQQEERLDTVLSFFDETKLNIVFYMITFEWQMNLEEVQQELEALLSCLNRYSSTMQIAPENVTNVLSGNRGSHFSKTMKPIDFLRFERDPRLFLMLYTMYSLHESLEDWIEQIDESKELLESAASRVVVKLGLRFLELLGKVPLTEISYDASFAALEETLGAMFLEENMQFRSNRLQQRLLELYPSRAQRKLTKFLTKEEKKMEKTLRREFDILLTRKALHRMKQNGRIDQRTYEKKLAKYN
jgi:division protein CdvB (Snf7/Vps24/ESCRT-III family)